MVGVNSVEERQDSAFRYRLGEVVGNENEVDSFGSPGVSGRIASFLMSACDDVDKVALCCELGDAGVRRV